MIKQIILRSILPVTLLALLTVAAQAQRGGHHGRPGLMPLTDEMKSELNLTEDQLTQLNELQETMCARMAELHEQQEDAERSDRREAARSLHQEMKQAFDDILTEEQHTQLRSLHRERREAHREAMQNVDHKAMRAELREYKETKVRPVMQEQRRQLDEVLTDEDQALLTEIRALIRADREQAKTERQERREERQERMENRERPRRGERGERGMRQQRGDGQQAPQGKHARRGHKGPRWVAEHPEQWDALKAMAERYDSEITNLLEDLADEREQWKADEQAIRQSYLPKGFERPQGEKQAFCPELQSERQSHRQDMHKIHFLLIDPDGTFDQEEDTAENAAGMKATAYPNPAVNQTTLSFTQGKEGAVRIELRDESGNIVRTLSRDTYTVGDHRVDVDLGSLQNGTYYLTLTGVDGTESVKLVVVK